MRRATPKPTLLLRTDRRAFGPPKKTTVVDVVVRRGRRARLCFAIKAERISLYVGSFGPLLR